MNLAKLFEMQKELDDRILAEHPIQEGEVRLAKKILALLVELGELANEARFFKFWSHDQEPRTEVKIPCRFCGGHGEGYFAGHKWTGKKEKCISCNGTGIEGLKNPLLEEYVDGLHFLFSIGLDENVGILEKVEISKCADLTSQFLELYNAISNLLYDLSEYPYIFGLYL